MGLHLTADDSRRPTLAADASPGIGWHTARRHTERVLQRLGVLS